MFRRKELLTFGEWCDQNYDAKELHIMKLNGEKEHIYGYYAYTRFYLLPLYKRIWLKLLKKDKVLFKRKDTYEM